MQSIPSVLSQLPNVSAVTSSNHFTRVQPARVKIESLASFLRIWKKRSSYHNLRQPPLLKSIRIHHSERCSPFSNTPHSPDRSSKRSTLALPIKVVVFIFNMASLVHLFAHPQSPFPSHSRTRSASFQPCHCFGLRLPASSMSSASFQVD